MPGMSGAVRARRHRDEWLAKWKTYAGRKGYLTYRLPNKETIKVRGAIICVARNVTTYGTHSLIFREYGSSEYIQVPVKYAQQFEYENQLRPEQIEQLWSEVMEEIANERAARDEQEHPSGVLPDSESADEWGVEVGGVEDGTAGGTEDPHGGSSEASGVG